MGAVISTLLLIGIVFLVLWASEDDSSNWRIDSRNPCRRYCVHCGQQQDFYEPGGWLTIGVYRECPIKDHEKEDMNK